MSSKVALVTGAGKKRVGWQVGQALAQRGYSLAIHYHRSSNEAAETVQQFRANGVEAEAFQADLADEQATLAMVDSVVQRFARLDVLVTCAAIWERKRLEETTAA